LVAHCFREAGVVGSNPIIPIGLEFKPEKGSWAAAIALLEPFSVSWQKFFLFIAFRKQHRRDRDRHYDSNRVAYSPAALGYY
jgi:hypothetical protein